MEYKCLDKTRSKTIRQRTKEHNRARRAIESSSRASRVKLAGPRNMAAGDVARHLAANGAFKWTKKGRKRQQPEQTCSHQRCATDIAERRNASGCSRRHGRALVYSRREAAQRDVNDDPNKYQLCCSHCSLARYRFWRTDPSDSFEPPPSVRMSTWAA